MSDFFWKVWMFLLEIAIGVLIVASAGLLLLLLHTNPGWFAGHQLWDKGAFALLTMGGTVCVSGVFRVVFANKVDKVEQNIIKGITQFQPLGISRVQNNYRRYRYLYWRTYDRQGKATWLRFKKLSWMSQVHPVEIAETSIEGKDNQSFVCAMVQLHQCLVVIATRLNPDRTLHWEMAGVNVFHTTFNEPGNQLFGYLRHQSMGDEQALSSCILSTEPLLDPATKREKTLQQLDAMWSTAQHGHAVRLNLGNSNALPFLQSAAQQASSQAPSRGVAATSSSATP